MLVVWLAFQCHQDWIMVSILPLIVLLVSAPSSSSSLLSSSSFLLLCMFFEWLFGHVHQSCSNARNKNLQKAQGLQVIAQEVWGCSFLRLKKDWCVFWLRSACKWLKTAPVLSLKRQLLSQNWLIRLFSNFTLEAEGKHVNHTLATFGYGQASLPEVHVALAHCRSQDTNKKRGSNDLLRSQPLTSEGVSTQNNMSANTSCP